MSEIVTALQGRDGAFGHREHLHLAWAVLDEYGADAGEETLCALIRIAAAANGFADRYHETTTRFWCRTMAPRMGEPDSFDDWYDANPDLHDKRLVKTYFSQPLLETTAAFEGWVEPDLQPMRT